MVLAFKNVPSALRTLLVCSVINMAGAGVMTSTYAIYMATFLGLTPVVVGIVLGAGSAAGALLALPAGRLVDSRGPKIPLCLGNLSFGVLMFALIWTTNPLIIGAVLLLAGATMSFNAPARSVYVVSLSHDNSGIVASRSLLRSASTLGLGIGALIGSLVVASNNEVSYEAAIFANAITSIVVAIIMALKLSTLSGSKINVSVVKPVRKRITSTFMLFTAMSGLLMCTSFAVTSGLGIWMVKFSHAPAWIFPLFSLISLFAIVSLQTRLSKPAVDIRSGRRVLLFGTLVCAVAVSFIPATGSVGAVGAALLLTLCVAVYVIGEMLIIAGVWAISYALRPCGQQGEYQGFDTAVNGVISVISPSIILWLCIDFSPGGWILLGAFSVICALLASLVVKNFKAHEDSN